MKKRKHDEDDWFPTPAELTRLRPIAKMDPELLAAHKKGTLKKRGRPPLEKKKEAVSLRLDPNVIAAFRAKGRGWQTRLNAFLRSAVADKRI